MPVPFGFFSNKYLNIIYKVFVFCCRASLGNRLSFCDNFDKSGRSVQIGKVECSELRIAEEERAYKVVGFSGGN